ncbi:hypothetical protein [Halorubrum sp. DTA98]|uniref:hypothetical protein n=1 Tax=Halorubrum sp. DTA98 TaxID=3402163 RepID=UPI003AAACD57
MRNVSDELTTATRPPTTIPLRHFLVALAFLVGGVTLGLLHLAGGPLSGSALGGIAIAHLLLIGWVCLTVLGAMTQFVPVWAGVELHSERLATLQLLLVSVGLAGFAGALWLGRPVAGSGFAALVVTGFAVFVYTLSRTLHRARPFDVTERHFALALAFFALAVVLGGTLAADYRWNVLGTVGIARLEVVDAHVTLAVLGGVCTTVIGALYQLGPMFTQSDPTPFDDRIAGIETVAYPVGVLALAAGRLFGHALLASGGGVLVAAGMLAAGIVLLRRLRDATATGTPMLSRYAVVAVAAVAWSLTAGATWVVQPLGTAVRFGHPIVGSVLLGAVIGFVVIGTLYHVVPFVVWLDRYSDRVGLERVPAIDDLYDGRVAAADFTATVAAGVLVLAAAVAPLGGYAGGVRLAGGGLLLVGVALFTGNVVSTVARHAGSSILGRLEK